ncbi:MAG: hypothetical protein GXO02_02120, partial [Epsilonproteobacteria bacterium]|nr:hypothetical protein [Campylobacterota bacterium]
GIISNLEEDGIHLIEWGSRELLEFLVKSGFNVYRLKIDIVSDSEREYKFEEFYYA